MATLLLGALLYPWFTVINLKSEQFSCNLREDFLTLQWIHSVERELWRETYRADNGAFLLFRSQFKTFGAGTPYNVPLHTQNGFVESNPNLVIPKIHWIISRNVESTLYTPQGNIPIYKFFNDYSEITISIQKHSIWTFYKDSCYDKLTISS